MRIALTSRRVMWLAFLGILMSLPSFAVGFFCDDYIHQLALRGGGVGWARPFDLYRFAIGDALGVQQLITHGPFTWWADPAIRAAFFRPIPSALLGLDFALFGQSPIGYHVQTVLWYGAFIAATGAFYRRVLPPALPFLALVFFVIDAGHASSLGWLAARYAIITATFSTAALWGYWRFRSTGSKASLGLALAAYGISLACAESALGLPCFLAAYEVFSTDKWSKRARALTPFAVLTLGYLVLHRVGGYGTSGSGLYDDPLFDPLRYLWVSPSRLVMLIGGLVANSPLDAGLLMAEMEVPLLLIGAVLAFLFGCLFRATLRASSDEDRRTLSRLALGSVLALVPSLGAPPGSRLLTFASVGGAPVVAAVVLHAWPSKWQRYAATGLLACKLLWSPVFFFAQLVAPEVRNIASRRTLSKLVTMEHHPNVVIFRVTDPFVGIYGPFTLAMEDGVHFENWNLLAATSHPMRITRIGTRELDVAILGGSLLDSPLEQVWRRDHELPVGFRAHTESFDVRVTEAKENRPTRLAVTLNDDVDSKRTAYLVQTPDGLVPFAFPVVGDSVELPAGPSPFAP